MLLSRHLTIGAACWLSAWTCDAGKSKSARKKGKGKGSKMCDLEYLEPDVSAIVTPEDGVVYDESRAQFASALGSTALSDFMLGPNAIVYADTDEDVVAAVDYAQTCGFSISIRSGGHQYSGFSSCKADAGKCLQVDVSNLEVFEHDPATDIVTFGAGLVLGQMVTELDSRGLILPMGICNGVGLGGHFSTSSYGAFARPFGLGMDHVVSFRIVTADAEILTVAPDFYPDLFKAVLGGGPGSFGVVLDYTAQAIRADAYPGSALVSLATPYSRAAYDTVFPMYMDMLAIPEYERDLTAYAGVSELDQNPGQNYIFVFIVWVGGIETTGNFVDGHYDRLVRPFLDTGLFSVRYDGPLPLNSFMDLFRFDADYAPYRYYVENIPHDQPLSLELISQLGDEIDSYLALPNVRVDFQFPSWGGTGMGSAYNRNTGLNAFPSRDIFINSDNWVYFLDSQEEQVRGLMTQFREQRAARFGDLSTVDLAWLTTDPLNADVADLSEDWPKYFPTYEAFAFSQRVKEEYDPYDLFSTDMTIPLPGRKGKGRKRSKRGGGSGKISKGKVRE